MKNAFIGALALAVIGLTGYQLINGVETVDLKDPRTICKYGDYFPATGVLLYVPKDMIGKPRQYDSASTPGGYLYLKPHGWKYDSARVIRVNYEKVRTAEDTVIKITPDLEKTVDVDIYKAEPTVQSAVATPAGFMIVSQKPIEASKYDPMLKAEAEPIDEKPIEEKPIGEGKP